MSGRTFDNFKTLRNTIYFYNFKHFRMQTEYSDFDIDG